MAESIAGGLIGDAMGAYGRKPKIPKLAEIDPTQVGLDTIAGNTSMLGSATALADQTNLASAANLKNLFKFIMPGAFEQATSNATSLLKGELPRDVQEAIQRVAAARGLQSGTFGSDFSKFGELRSLGISSLQAQDKGLSQFNAIQSMFPRMDTTSMFFSPQQRLEFAFNDRAARFQRDLLNEQVKAMPNPADVAIAQGFDTFFAKLDDAGFSAAGMGAGAAMGGGGGGMSGMSGGKGGSVNMGGWQKWMNQVQSSG